MSGIPLNTNKTQSYRVILEVDVMTTGVSCQVAQAWLGGAAPKLFMVSVHSTHVVFILVVSQSEFMLA